MNHSDPSSEESHYLFKEHCDDCGSSDAKAVYSDGGTHCFSCKTTHKTAEPTTARKERSSTTMDNQASPDFLRGEFKSLASRRLTEDTCRKYGYHVASSKGGPVQVANYRRDGELVAQKVRGKDKQFYSIGKPLEAGFYGQHLFREGGRQVVITEGEIDAMSIYQAMGSKWPVVSLPQGAQSAAKVIKQELTWLESYEKVILAFDMDEPGQEAVAEVASLLAPGKAFVASLPAKDGNECLVQGLHSQLVSSIWDAHPYRPDGVIDAKDLWEEVSKEEQVEQVVYPWGGLNDLLLGIRKGELTTITSGSGMGKSSVVRELLYHILKEGHQVGGLFLEESVKRTALGLMGIHCDVPLHIYGNTVDDQTKREAFDATAGTGRLMLYDHFGSMEIDNIIDKITYMASNGCEYIFLDHVSMVVSGIETNDERKMIDVLMTKLRTVVSRFNIGLIIVSHLKRPDGIAHENGGQTHLGQLRGSASIAQLSDACIGLERNQQDEDPNLRNMTLLRVLKNRYTGQTGPATYLMYNPQTGRLAEHVGPGESMVPVIIGHMPTQTADPEFDTAF